MLRAARATARTSAEPVRTGWGFNRFDLAWAAALLLLVLCNALIPLSGRGGPATLPQPQTSAEQEQLERELGLKGEIVVAAAPDTRRNGDAEQRVMRELEHL